MKEINQKQLLRILYEEETIDLYTWHQETCLSPISIANAVLSLRNKGLLQLSDNHEKATLTDYGRKWVEVHSKELFATKGDETWKNVPEEMISIDNKFFQAFFEVSDIKKLLENKEK